jgi:hypothetical protein
MIQCWKSTVVSAWALATPDVWSDARHAWDMQKVSRPISYVGTPTTGKRKEFSLISDNV